MPSFAAMIIIALLLLIVFFLYLNAATRGVKSLAGALNGITARLNASRPARKPTPLWQWLLLAAIVLPFALGWLK